MLTNRTKIIGHLIDMAAQLRAIHEDDGAQASVARARPITIAEVIETATDDPGLDNFPEDCAQNATQTTEQASDRWDAAIEVISNGDVMRTLGWLQGYAELAGYDNVRDLLRGHGVDSVILARINAGEITEPPPDNREPIPARVYHVVKDTLEATTKVRLEKLGPLTIKNIEHDVIDEYARQVATTIVGLLGL